MIILRIMRLKKALCATLFLGFGGILGAECPVHRSDSVPIENVVCADDEFLSGYVQALIDMHYYEFQVKVVVRNRCAYVAFLPNNDLLSKSILCFIQDVPGIEAVECVACDGSDLASCLSCAPCMVAPSSQISGIWFPQSTVLFKPLIADPRQVINGASIRFNDNVIGKHVGAVSFGDEFPFYRWKNIGWFCGDFEVGIEAGIFAVFDLDNPDACMFNTDFFVAGFGSYAFDCWSFRLRLWHMSSHVGDEFLLANDDFDRCNVSDEGIDLFASYQLSRFIRLYAGVGDIVARDKSFPEKPFYFEFGTEVRAFGCRDSCNRLYAQPFFAMNFRSWAEHGYALDQTYALGMEWSKIQGVGKSFRLFAEYHNGFCEEGQFIRERCNYFAIKVTYGF